MQKVTRNGQITIPIEIRKQFDLKEGDSIDIDVVNAGIRIRIIDRVETTYRQLDCLKEKVEEPLKNAT